MESDFKAVILNVDDDESGRYVTTRILERGGFIVRQAATGREALQFLELNPDLVLLDVNLPDMNGMEVCRRIKSDARTASIPVLHLSATSTSENDRIVGLEGGADAYLTQPVDPGLLLATINALLRARRAERGLSAAVRQWQVTVDAIGYGVCLLDRDGRIRAVNRAMAALAGKPAEKLIGRMHQEFFRQTAEAHPGWPFDLARRNRRREVAEVLSGDRWFEVTADPVFDEADEFAGAVRTVVDITAQRRERKEREQLLRQLEAERARLETVLNHMPAGVLIAEAPSGKIVMANQEARHILGHAVEGRDVRDGAQSRFRHPDGRVCAADELPLVRSLLAGETVSGEDLEYDHPDGAHFALRVSAAPIRNPEGYIVAAVATLHDLTERKDLEEQLRQSQKMEAVGRLAGGVAHDFNNLLTIIGGYGQMLMDGLRQDDPMRRDLEAILEASERATTLTRQLLTFSRRQMSQPRVLDLNRLVSKMNRILRRVIGEDVALRLDLKPDLGRIKADPGQMEQVIMNLVVNARDAMPKGGKLAIATSDVEAGAEMPRKRAKLRPGRYVLLSVADTGTGMDADTRSHLFEPFFTTKPKGKGTGLGLSTVYGIVKQSGGEIEVDTEQGKGTTFRLYFPVAVDADRASQGSDSASADLRGTETILLVEDEDEVRRFARELLARHGYAVLEAASGAEALRVWKKHRGNIDLLLTDVIMPQMSGKELANRLKASRRDLKVLYMSGYTDEVIAEHGVLDSGTELLQKPFTHESLGRKVRQVLGDRKPS